MAKKTLTYLTTKSNIISLLAFVALFSLIFILIYRPFKSTEWMPNLSTDKYVFYASIIVIIGLGVLAVSRFVMYKTKEILPLYRWRYFAWMLMEIVCISLACNLFAWIINGISARNFFDIFPASFYYTAAIMFLPYTISWLYFAFKNNSDKSISGEDMPFEKGIEKKELVNFKDDKGVLRLSVTLESLLYIEAADNYVNIRYVNKGKISQFVLRTSLKNIEEQFLDKELVRCHRSYIVNFLRIKILRKEKENLFLEFDTENVPDIPVSKTYAENILELFSKHSH